MLDPRLEEALTGSLIYQQTYPQILTASEQGPVPPAADREDLKTNKKPNALVTYTALDLQRKEFPEPVCVVKNLLVVGLTLLAGVPKGGKSWWALLIALAKAS